MTNLSLTDRPNLFKIVKSAGVCGAQGDNGTEGDQPLDITAHSRFKFISQTVLKTR
jgi:hypothetical protein